MIKDIDNYYIIYIYIVNSNYFVFDEAKKICRDMSKAVLFNGSIPYLAPEIALLYKSSQAEREEYHYDFQ